MNDFKQDIFSTPLWISNREDNGEFNKNVANLVYKFRDNATNAGLVSDSWNEFEKSSSQEDFKNKGITSFYSDNLATNPEWKQVVVDLLDQAKQTIRSEFGLGMENMWTTVYPQEGFIPKHTHPGSTISGVYYVKAAPQCGNIEFEDPSWALKQSIYFSNSANHTIPNSPQFWVEPQPGRMILFPSYLPHSTKPNKSGEDRIILSFNLYFLDK